MDTGEQGEDFQRLQELIESTSDVKGFLDGMTSHAAEILSRATGARIECRDLAPANAGQRSLAAAKRR
ncbi:hypothetical protein NicSoilE8_43300 (plasmid) [Arthrobacter sp. NicSoilE8]|nr:hypothetical protein NicSoilE8_43300 [Arthrobacter sp. NicSoilE8]